MADSNFNAYELFEIDPAESTQAGAIKQLEDKLAKVARLSMTERDEVRARGDLLKIHAKDARAILEDENTREAHRRAYRSILDTRCSEARPLIDLLRARGSFGASDVNEIVTRCKLPETEVRKLLSKAGVLEGSKGPKPAAPTWTPPQATLQNVAESIKCDLIPANVETLYEFIGSGYGPASSASAIKLWCDQTDARLAKGGKGTPSHIRDTKLLGHIRTHLLNPDARRKYDNYLANQGMASLEGVIRMVGHEQKVVTREGLASILRVARTRGIAEKEAEKYVAWWVNKTKGWSLQKLADDKPIEPLSVCGFCREVGGAGDSRCRKCGHDLHMACPSCRRSNPTERASCECGFPIGDLPLIEKEMVAARTELAATHLAAAAALARKILATWPLYTPATDLVNEADRRQKQMDAEQAGAQSRIREAEKLAGLSRFVSAAAVLREVAIKHPGLVTAELNKRVSERLAEARRLFEAGRAAESRGDLATAAKSMESALAACHDLEEAAAGLRRFPPPAPTRLTATVEATCIRLVWTPASGTDLRYLIRRKEGGVPSSHTDGDEVGETIAGRFDDITATDGRVWHYAVYTLRAGVSHSQPATAGPALRPGKPKIEGAVAARGVARITVATPYGCEKIEVVRLPAGGNMTRSGSVFEETGLRNGISYTYSFRAVYRNPCGGAPLQSEPVSIAVTPEEIPEPLDSLVLDASGPVVVVTWKAPRIGKVVLRATDREPANLAVGMEIDPARIESIGRAVGGLAPTSAQVPLPTAGRLVVIPFTVSGSTAIVGKWQQVNRLPEVEKLTAQAAGAASIELLWEWPPGVEDAVVTLYADAAATRRLQTLPVKRKIYEQVGNFFRIELGAGDPKLAIVQCVSSCGSFQSTGRNVKLTFGRRGSVNYRIDNGGSIKSKFARMMGKLPAGPLLVIESSQCQQVLDLVLVGRASRLPLDADDGEVIQEIKRIEIKNGRADIPLSVSLRQPMYVKAFLRQPELQPDVELQAPAKEHLLLR